MDSGSSSLLVNQSNLTGQPLKAQRLAATKFQPAAFEEAARDDLRELYSHQRTRVRHEAAKAIEPEYDIRKLVGEGRRRVRQERLNGKTQASVNGFTLAPYPTNSFNLRCAGLPETQA